MTEEELAKLLNKIPVEKLQEIINSKTAAVEVKKTKTRVNEDFTVNREKKTNRSPVKYQDNQWQDNGEHREEDKIVKTRSERKREPFKKIDIRCDVCGSINQVSSNLPRTNYYRCERCV